MAIGGDTAAQDWTWRVSVADIAQAGPFSIYPGVDRHLMLIEGRGIVLQGGAATMRLERIGDCVAFPGEQTLNVELIDGPVRVWNLMIRRGVVKSSMRVCRNISATRDSSDSRARVMLVLDGAYMLRAPGCQDAQLQPGDGLSLDWPFDGFELVPASRKAAILVTQIH